MRDIVETCARASRHEILDVAAAFGVEAVLARGVLVATSMLALDGLYDRDGTNLTRWAFDVIPSRSDRMNIRAYTAPTRSYAGQMRAGLHAVPGHRAKLGYVRDLVCPDRAYLAEREGSYRRRALHSLRRRT